MRLAGVDGTAVTLRPVGYQFEEARTDGWDDLNWLTVAGDVETPEGSWSFVDSCMQTTEARELLRWLRGVANGDVSPTVPGSDGLVYPDLHFTEPNVGFGLDAAHGSLVSIRTYFSLESAPPWSGEEQRRVSHEFFVRCEVTQDELFMAAECWEKEIAEFPVRGTSGASRIW